MGKLLPVIFILIGGAIGGGAGVFVKPAPKADCSAMDVVEMEECEAEQAEHEEPIEMEDEVEVDYVAMKNQFVVPIIHNEMVKSLVVMSLSLETTAENVQELFDKEPKLRDAFLRVMFEHSHIGGFDGAFTESGRMDALRVALLEAARLIAGKKVSDILITDIARQEM